MNDKPYILVVEDDPDISFMLKLMLERKGFTAILAANEVDIAESMSNNTVDLVILDMLLSGIDGTDICKKLKQEHQTSHIPVVMVSAHPNAKETSLAAGANDFISKPFDMGDLILRVNRLIREVDRV
jgi:DNA-binding response OmpR family regulator